MKKQFKFLALILFMVTSTGVFAGAKVTVGGIIKGYKGEEAVLIQDIYDPNDQGLTLKVAKDGSFKTEFAAIKPMIGAALNIGGNIYMLYFEPNGKYQIKVDISSEGDESQYSVQGSNVQENLFVKNFTLKFHRFYLLAEQLNPLTSYRDYSAFFHKVADDLTSELKQINNEAFAKFYTAEIEQDKTLCNFLFEFTALNRVIKQDGNLAKFSSDPAYDAFLKSTEWTTCDSKNFDGAKQIFGSYVMFVCAQIDILDILKTIKKVVPHQNDINDFATIVMTNFYATGGKGDADQVFDYYKTICTDTQALKKIDQARSYAKALAAGAPAPDFEIKDSQGKTRKISDFKGKALYVDIWATWCGPCKAEVPFFKKLVAHYKGDNRIEFISVSVDANQKAWSKMIADQPHPWSQYIVENDFNSELCTRYQITSIPRFLLIDKNGNIVDANALEPSNEAILENINKVL